MKVWVRALRGRRRRGGREAPPEANLFAGRVSTIQHGRTHDAEGDVGCGKLGFCRKGPSAAVAGGRYSPLRCLALELRLPLVQRKGLPWTAICNIVTSKIADPLGHRRRQRPPAWYDAWAFPMGSCAVAAAMARRVVAGQFMVSGKVACDAATVRKPEGF